MQRMHPRRTVCTIKGKSENISADAEFSLLIQNRPNSARDTLPHGTVTVIVTVFHVLLYLSLLHQSGCWPENSVKKYLSAPRATSAKEYLDV